MIPIAFGSEVTFDDFLWYGTFQGWVFALVIFLVWTLYSFNGNADFASGTIS